MNSLLLLSSVLAFPVSGISSAGGVTDGLINRHLYRDFYPDMMQKIKVYLYESSLDNFQTNCSQELLQFWGDLDGEKQAAYLDSFGKVGAGILTGNIQYLGYYDECIDIGNTDYCRFPFSVALTTTGTTAAPSNASITIPVEFGMCFPSSCDAKDFYNLFFIGSNGTFSESFTVITDSNAVFYKANVTASVGYIKPLCPWKDLKWTNSSIVVLSVCVLLIVLVIIGTMIDVSLWLIDDILPKLDLPGRKPQITITNCEVKHSINEDEPLINAKNKQKASDDK